jgi:superfamily II DNA/RNA helicase
MNHPHTSSGATRQERRRRRPRVEADRTPRPNAAFSPAAALDHQPTSQGAAAASFEELAVPAPIIAALATTGVTAPFPIQARTMVDSLAGRDVLGRGKTGSGKTIAFAVPVVAALAASGRTRQPAQPRALVLVPTRELAKQVADTVRPLATAMGLRVTTVFGGVGQGPQVAAMRNGVDIVVACPGRLEDLIAQRACRLDRIEVTVLDEADHMADLGFLPSVKRLLDATPQGTQRLLFSATLDNGIDGLVQRYLRNPVVHSVDSASAVVTTMTHHFLTASQADKLGVVTALAGGTERSLLFTRTKHGAKKLAKQLATAGIPAVELHGNLSQGARERNLASFADGSTKVLVATDIAARGIHVDDIALVVHVDPPAEHKAYLHRSGRTARAGASGVVITIVTPEQANDARALARAAKITPTITKVDPSHAMLGELAGPAAPRVRHVASAPPQQRAARPTGGGRPGRRTDRAGGAGRDGRGSAEQPRVGVRSDGTARPPRAARHTPKARANNGGRRQSSQQRSR